MSVVLTMKHFTYATRDTVCTVCGEKLFPPFVEWHGRPGFFMCAECCQSIKAGLMADIIQVAAIAEIRSLRAGTYYTGVVLERVSAKESEAAQMKAWEGDVGMLSTRATPKVPKKV